MVGPRAVFATPLPPTGTLLVASMAVVSYHLDLAPLGVRHALSTPRIHVLVRVRYPCRHLPSHGPFDALLPTLRVSPHR